MIMPLRGRCRIRVSSSTFVSSNWMSSVSSRGVHFLSIIIAHHLFSPKVITNWVLFIICRINNVKQGIIQDINNNVITPHKKCFCEKHSVANNLGSGEDLSEVVIYSRLQWRAPHKQESTPTSSKTQFIYFLMTGPSPVSPLEWVIQVHNLSDASQTMPGLQLPACFWDGNVFSPYLAWLNIVIFTWLL